MHLVITRPGPIMQGANNSAQMSTIDSLQSYLLVPPLVEDWTPSWVQCICIGSIIVSPTRSRSIVKCHPGL